MHCVKPGCKPDCLGDADIIVAGGMENMSVAPYLLYNAKIRLQNGRWKDG